MILLHSPLLTQWLLFMVQAGKKISSIKDKNIFRHCCHPQSTLKICVIVPAKNEEDTIMETLDALRNQLLKNGRKLDFSCYEVLLLANNCTDKTYEIAQNYAAKFPEFNLQVVAVFLPRKKANIGYVRRILMDEACRRLLMNGLKDGIIASTDGDTIVDNYWLTNIMHEIALGSDAVGGRILTNSLNPKARLYYLRDVSYRLLIAKAAAIIDPEKNNPWPCHYQYFGASLAVTCSMYDYCGRLPGVPHLEDMALYNALIKVDAKIRCSPAVKVYTSGRIDGRVEIGFSEQLKQWVLHNNNQTPQMVEPAASLLIKLKCKRLLRICQETYAHNKVIEKVLIEIICEKLLIDANWLNNEVAQATYFGALWQAVDKAMGVGDFYESYPAVLITEAIYDLKQFIHNP